MKGKNDMQETWEEEWIYKYIFDALNNYEYDI